MQRREAIQLVSVLLGGAIIGADAFLSGCKTTPRKEGLFSNEDIALLNDAGDTILPTTPDSPGAKAANVGEFMKVWVTDCYTPEDQDVFTKGLVALNDAANQKYSNDFVKLTADQKHGLLSDMDKQTRGLKGDDQKKSPLRYFIMLKQMTIMGYFTSEVGATKALRYLETPGHYDGDVPYKKGEKAWAL